MGLFEFISENPATSVVLALIIGLVIIDVLKIVVPEKNDGHYDQHRD